MVTASFCLCSCRNTVQTCSYKTTHWVSPHDTSLFQAPRENGEILKADAENEERDDPSCFMFTFALSLFSLFPISESLEHALQATTCHITDLMLVISLKCGVFPVSIITQVIIESVDLIGRGLCHIPL